MRPTHAIRSAYLTTIPYHPQPSPPPSLPYGVACAGRAHSLGVQGYTLILGVWASVLSAPDVAVPLIAREGAWAANGAPEVGTAGNPPGWRAGWRKLRQHLS